MRLRCLMREVVWLVGRDRAAAVGAVLVVAVICAGALAPVLTPYDPLAIRVDERFALPTTSHWLGTDELGRDVLSRLLFGARASLSVGVVAIGIAATIGTALGLLAGYRDGLASIIILRGVDSLLAFPTIILALAITAALGPSLTNAAIAIGIVTIPVFARLAQASALALRAREFVEATRASGATDLYILARVVLPNHVSPLAIQATISFANAVLAESALSFLGLGVQPPTPSWGAMLDVGRKFLTQTPWYSVSAGAAIFLTLLGLNLLGDGLRDIMDPRLRRRSPAPPDEPRRKRTIRT